MSIQLEMTVTGGELARALLRDEEELAYALKEMAEDVSTPKDIERVGCNVADFLQCGDREAVVTFLRALSDAIEGAL